MMRRARRDAGFTLVEALVTLFILALMAGAVVMLTPGEAQKTRQFVAEFADRMALASEESIVINRSHALILTPDGYGYQRLENTGWQAMERGSPLSFRPWPSYVSYRLEGAAVDEDSGRVARFDSMGGSTPTRIEIDGPGSRWMVALGGQGRAHVEELD